MKDSNNITAASVVLTADFAYPDENNSSVYSVVYQLRNISYKIILNNHIIDSGNPEFDGAGNIPIRNNLLNNGVNIICLEIDPHHVPEKFTETSACDIAVIGAEKGDMASSFINENSNILARISCVDFPKDAVAKPKVVQKIKERGQETYPNEIEKTAVEETMLEIAILFKNRDVNGVRTYLLNVLTKENIEEFMPEGNENMVEAFMDTMYFWFKYFSIDTMSAPQVKWEKGKTSIWLIDLISGNDNDGKLIGTHKFKVNNSRWYWIGVKCTGMA